MKGEQDTRDIYVVYFFLFISSVGKLEKTIFLFLLRTQTDFFLKAFLISMFPNSLVRSRLPALHAFFFVLRSKKTFHNPLSSLVNTHVNLMPTRTNPNTRKSLHH